VIASRSPSLRVKIPLRVSLLVIIVGCVITASLLYRAFGVFREDLLVSSANLGRILARSLVTPMLHDDVWKAYEVINTPFGIDTKQGALQADLVLVISRNGRVYVSTQPSDYPMLSEIGAGQPELNDLRRRIEQAPLTDQQLLEGLGFNELMVLTPIISDGVLLGTLVMGYSRDIFSQRFLGFAWQAALTTLLIVIIVLAPAVYLARRFTDPLVKLSNCMSMIGSRELDEIECALDPSPRNDELDQLQRQFRLMLAELRDKQQLEQQMVVTERLAAIGRFTAGIAHEINNPLGGLLTATNTLLRHGQLNPMAEKTVRLIERGLKQIRDTVGTLLVEAKHKSHPMSRQDIDDIQALLQPEAQRRRVALNWDNRVEACLALPSTLVRQVLINLVLNAIAAAPEEGWVDCRSEIEHETLLIEVSNSGEQISDEVIAHLFEPFMSHQDGGRGLGLWVTYQIVTGLNGTIEVDSGPVDTRFTIILPLPLMAAA